MLCPRFNHVRVRLLIVMACTFGITIIKLISWPEISNDDFAVKAAVGLAFDVQTKLINRAHNFVPHTHGSFDAPAATILRGCPQSANLPASWRYDGHLAMFQCVKCHTINANTTP